MTGFIIGATVVALAAAFIAYVKAKAVILHIHAQLDRIAEAAAARDERAANHTEAVAARAELAALVQATKDHTQQVVAARRDLARLHAAARMANVLASPQVIDHLDALRLQQVPPPRLSYGFQAAIQALNPEVTRRGTGRTVVCTLALGDDYQAKVQPVIASHRAYAQARGFSHALLAQPPSWSDRPPSWMKIPLIQGLFQQGFDRVVYIDADALVTNPAFDAEAVFGAPVADGRLTLTEDEAGINCGVMFVEDGPATRRLLDLVWLNDADIFHGTWEQFALKSLMSLSADIRRHVSIEPDPRRFNSFAPERNRFYRTMERSTWQPGDFVCHFSGIRSPHLEELVARYAASLALPA
jgi:hypothetical protein